MTDERDAVNGVVPHFFKAVVPAVPSKLIKDQLVGFYILDPEKYSVNDCTRTCLIGYGLKDCPVSF